MSYFDEKDVAQATYKRINFEGVFYLQYAYKKYVTDIYSTLINEYFIDSESMMRRKIYLGNKYPYTIEFLDEGAGIIKDGMLIPSNERFLL